MQKTALYSTKSWPNYLTPGPQISFEAAVAGGDRAISLTLSSVSHRSPLKNKIRPDAEESRCRKEGRNFSHRFPVSCRVKLLGDFATFELKKREKSGNLVNITALALPTHSVNSQRQ